MDLRIIKKVLGIGLLTAAAITNSNAYAAQANVTVDINLPTVLVMYHYDTITLDISEAALAGYLAPGTTTCTGVGGGECDVSADPGPIALTTTLTQNETVTQNIAGTPISGTTDTNFTLEGVVGVRALGCATYTATQADAGTSDASVTITGGPLAGINGEPCTFGMTRGDLTFNIDFDAVAASAAPQTVSAVFDVTITGA